MGIDVLTNKIRYAHSHPIYPDSTSIKTWQSQLAVHLELYWVVSSLTILLLKRLSNLDLHVLVLD